MDKMKIFHTETNESEIYLGEILLDRPFDEIFKLFQVLQKKKIDLISYKIV